MTDPPLQVDTTTVAVLTYRRNDDLAVAVPHLLREAATVSPPATVLIIDNDPAGGAAEYVNPISNGTLRYVHEPQPGIAAARNRALSEAGSRYLVFIDDDMHPEAGWLASLLTTQRATGAVLVAGPVLEEYEVEPDEYVRAGRFFVRRRLPTGTVLTVAASGNLLIDLPALSTFDVEFDARFGLLGGSDHLFTRALNHKGALMVWCDEAITYDRVPADRSTRAWVLRRAYRVGNSQILVSLLLAGGPMARFRVRMTSTVGGLARVVLGEVRALYGAALHRAVHRARGERAVRRGAGMIAGAWGQAYAEYERPLTQTQTQTQTQVAG